MNLNEAIAHCEEKAEELNQRAESAENNGQYQFSDECKECANEHKQLAEWLKELETLRKAFELACEVSAFCCCEDVFTHKCDNDCATHWEEYFMQKARTENDTKGTV